MASDIPRIPPIDPAEFTDEQAQLVGKWTEMNFARVLVRHPGMYRAFVGFLAEVITNTGLPQRDRQIICLRMLTLCNDVYECTHHARISLNVGVTEEEVAAFRAGEGDCLTDHDRTVIRATEELQRDQCISDATWRELAGGYDQQQLMEVVFLGGCYETMAMITRSFGIPLESPEIFERLNAIRDYD